MPASRKLIALALLGVIVFCLCCREEEEAPIDKTPPTVVASFPQSGETNVSRTGPYWVAFSEAMDTVSVRDALSITPVFPFNSFWRVDTIFVAPNSIVEAATTCTLAIDTSAKDLFGNALSEAFEIVFTTTSEPDQTRPTVVKTQPSDDATGVHSGEPIIITFSEPMKIDTIRDAVSVEPSVELDIRVEANIVTIDHPGFPPDSLITVVIDTTATDLAANHLESEYSFSFRTAQDLISPHLKSANPANGATGVSTNLSEITFIFSEPMDPYSFMDFPIEDLDARLRHLLLDRPDFKPPFTTVILRVGEPLLPGCTYWLTLRDVTDAAGNIIDPNPTDYHFTTKGSLTYFPLTYPNWWEYSSPQDEWTETFKIENYNKSTGTFDYNRYDESGSRKNAQKLRLSGNMIYIRGVTDYDENGDIEMSLNFDNPLPYIPTDPRMLAGDRLDLQASGEANISGTTFNFDLTGTLAIDPDTTFITVDRLDGSFKDCAALHLQVTLFVYADGDTLTLEVDNVVYLAPGVGIVKRIEIDSSEGRADTTLITNWGKQ
ncbi:MAG: Ig-like domain-containing protein [bacterium]